MIWAKGKHARAVREKRLARAVVAVALVLLLPLSTEGLAAFAAVLPAFGAVRAAGSGDAGDGAQEGALATGSGLDAARIVNLFAGGLLGDASTTVECLPPGLQEEIALPEDAGSPRINEGQNVVGYEAEASVDQALENLAQAMQGKGWQAMDLGSVAGRTFVKQAGFYRQALATASSFNGASSVVLQVL